MNDNDASASLVLRGKPTQTFVPSKLPGSGKGLGFLPVSYPGKTHHVMVLPNMVDFSGAKGPKILASSPALYPR